MLAEFEEAGNLPRGHTRQRERGQGMGLKECDAVGFVTLSSVPTDDLAVKEELIDVIGGRRVGMFILVIQGQQAEDTGVIP